MLKLNTDSFYAIGSSHEVCQDYALNGKVNDHIHYAIISDGCSSSQDVDVGARILVHSVKEFLFYNYKDRTSINDDFHYMEAALRNFVLASSHVNFKHLGLVNGSLNATLVIAISDGATTRTFIYGDGGFITKSIDGTVNYYYASYESNAPYYLSYDGEPEVVKRYMEELGKTNRVLISNQEYISSGCIHNPEIMLVKDFNYDLRKTVFEFKTALSFIGVVSDGVESFIDVDTLSCVASSKPVSHDEIVSWIANGMKNTNGSFIKRRMERIIRDCKKMDRGYYDDLSIAGINITRNSDVDNSDGEK